MNYPLWFDCLMSFVLCVVLFIVATQSKIPDTSKTFGFFLCLVAIFLFGFAPAHEDVGTDRPVYAEMFLYADDTFRSGFRDIGFAFYVKLCDILTGCVTGGFVISAIIYIFSITYFYIKSNPGKFLYLLLLSFLSLEFTNHYYNGLRSGLAISFLLIAFSKGQRKNVSIIFSLLAVSFHISALLVVAAYYITSKYSNTKILLWFWLIMLVALLVGVFNSFEQFAGVFGSMEDRRLNTYLLGSDRGYKVGLRLDFISYSLFPILVGWYYIFKKKVNDVYYIHIYNVYLFCNACWLTISKMPSNNRLAYLSWLFIPFILLYPILHPKNNSLKCKKILMFLLIVIIVGVNLFLKYIRER